MKTFLLLSALGAAFIASTASAQYASGTAPYCREFTQVVDIGGRAESAYGTACMQPDGSWQIVSDDIPSTQPVNYIPTQNQVVYVPQTAPVSTFSISFSSWNNPSRMRYYNDYGHGWRDDRRHGTPGRRDHPDRGRHEQSERGRSRH